MEFLQEYYEVGKLLTQKDRRRLFDAIMEYGFNDALPDTSNWGKKLKAVWGLAFALVKQTCKKPKQVSSENSSKTEPKTDSFSNKNESVFEQNENGFDSKTTQNESKNESILNQNRSKNDSFLIQKRTENDSKTIQNHSKNEQFLSENCENPENTAKTGGFSEPKQAQNPPSPEKNANERESEKESEKEKLPSSSPLNNPLIITIKEKDKEKDKENVKNSRACEDVKIEPNVRPKPEKVFYSPKVSLTPEEYEKLVAEYGVDVIAESIDVLDAYKTANGKKYVSDAGALRSWAIRECLTRRQKAENAKIATKQPHFGGLNQNPTPSSSFARNAPNFANSPPKIDINASTADLMRRGLLANPEDFNPDGSPKERPKNTSKPIEVEDLPFF